MTEPPTCPGGLLPASPWGSQKWTLGGRAGVRPRTWRHTGGALCPKLSAPWTSAPACAASARRPCVSTWLAQSPTVRAQDPQLDRRTLEQHC